MSIDDEVFQTLLEQVRELHRRTDEITSSKTRMHDHIRPRVSWKDPPSLPSAQRDFADEVVEALGIHGPRPHSRGSSGALTSEGRTPSRSFASRSRSLTLA